MVGISKLAHNVDIFTGVQYNLIVENEWKLIGFDAFEEEYYPLAGSYPDENSARQAGRLKLKEFDKTQPCAMSGGQEDLAVQDRIYIQRPDRSRYRFIPLPEELDQKPS